MTDAAAEKHGEGPQTLALVIGASRYSHLGGKSGIGRTTDTYGLSELSVSALTAYRFAEWLREAYRVSGKPLARCWLLASPTEDELRVEPGLAGVLEPTFRNIEDAIWEWYTAARDLSATNAQRSRLVFFFSGHGLERMMDEQLLLPSDYLKRGLVNRAINVRDLRQALAACGVSQQLYLIDACRNDHPGLRDLGLSLTGTQVLNPLDNSRSNPDLDAPVLYGSSSGQQAFGPRSVDDGLTLFGQALLSGLTVPPADSVVHDSGDCVMLIDQLQEYMTARIAELMRTYDSAATQRVMKGGQSAGRFVMSELACDGFAPTNPPSVRESERLGRTATVEFVDPTSGQLIGASEGEDPFGDAGMAEIWSGKRLARLGALDEESGPDPELTLVRVDRRGTSLYDIVIRVDSDPIATVLTLSEGPDGTGRRFDCHLPWVGHGALFALRLARNDSGRLVHIETDLDLANTSSLGRTAEAWRTYHEQSAVAALPILSDGELSDVVTGASPSPLPLVVAGLIRLAAGHRLDPKMVVDAAVVYSSWSDLEMFLLESRGREYATSVDPTRLSALALPRTADAMALAWRQLPHLHSATASGDGVIELRERLAEVLPRMQPGSLFPVILSTIESVDLRSEQQR
ncbi:caspase family protein [Arthrobacter sp. MDT3-24]